MSKLSFKLRVGNQGITYLDCVNKPVSSKFYFILRHWNFRKHIDVLSRRHEYLQKECKVLKDFIDLMVEVSSAGFICMMKDS